MTHEPQLEHTKPGGRNRRGIKLGAGLATLALACSALVTGSGIFVDAAPVGADFKLDAGDLRHILKQIQISEAHSAGGDLLGPGPLQVNERRLPFGLRTVDGSMNHLTPGQTDFGAADTVFPRLTTPVYRPAEPAPPGFGPPGGPASSYNQTKGFVFDSAPRMISNAIVDQTEGNPAAVAASTIDGVGCAEKDGPVTCFIGNEAPDIGLSAPFNSMFTFFGQFFDHGLDLVTKGGGTVMVPLQPDDPLYSTDPGAPNFLLLTRAKNQPGPDGITGDLPGTPAIDESADDVKEATNTTTSFVDQNQTYTSHPSHQVFLREYEMVAGQPRSTGSLIDGGGLNADGDPVNNIGNWREVKQQAHDLLGIDLTDADIFNVPLLATDAYGYFIRGPVRGMPMVMFANGTTAVEGDPTANGGLGVSVAGSDKTGHAFLDDIAHNANPKNSQTGLLMPADTDTIVNLPVLAPLPEAGVYDDELLDEHFVTGDGRGNENIGLTAVHTIFHSEHNRLAIDINNQINALLTQTEIDAWHAIGPSGWDFGERLFQASRFVTEMEYQHLVFEEFARKLVPTINAFIGDGINFQSDTDPSIVAEFAHTVYRLGHSMLTENIPRTYEDGSQNDILLFDGFLNPLEFNNGPAGTLSASQAAGAIFMGGTREVGNHIDEFITNVLRNQLLGLPSDLAVFNLARGRSEGIPGLNSVRRQLLEATGEFALAPYESWTDFAFNIKHQESLINFIAAYGTHPSIATFDLDGAGTTEFPGSVNSRRAAAEAIVLGTGPAPVPGDADAFLNSLDAWANLGDGSSTTGVEGIDLWIGGLAERTAPFGGMLGTTFNYIFEVQLENLQNADRFYYLERLDGLNLLPQLEANSFAELVQRNTTASGLPADIFSRPDFAIEVANLGTSGPILDDPLTPYDENSFLIRLPNGTIRFNGGEHVNWNGSDTLGDRIISSEGDDTLRGNGGNDNLEGGSGNDNGIGGAGDDIVTDIFGDDVLKGGPGHDAIWGGPGFDLLQGNGDDDYIIAGNDTSEVFGGAGDDVIFTGEGGLESFAGAGDDWMEAGPQLDLLVGDENNQFQNDPNQGHDVLIGGKGDDDYDSEGGDDIMVGDVLGTERFEGMLGFDLVTYKGDALPVDADMEINVVLAPNLDELRDRFDLTEGVSGFDQNDILRGTNNVAGDLVGHELTPAGITRISGIDAILNGATTFAEGDIIMGGGGSDILEGRAGDDILDGDRWLNVQLRATTTAGGTVFADALKQLQTAVRNGTINPGAIDIVRTIDTAVNGTSVDTARFSGPEANYTIVNNGGGRYTITDNVGTDGVDTLRNVEQAVFCEVPGPDIQTCATFSAPVLLGGAPPAGPNAALSLTTLGFANRAVPAGPTGTQLVTVTNSGTGTLNITGTTIAGIDAASTASFTRTTTCTTLGAGASCPVNVAFDPTAAGALSATLNIVTNAGTKTVALTGTGVNNSAAVGAPAINDTTPTEGVAISATLGSVADVNGVPGVVGYQWRRSTSPTNAVSFVIPGATNPTYLPTQDDANRRLTVTVTFVDDAGSAESRTSAITTVVGDVFVGVGNTPDTLTGTASQDEYHGGGGNDNLSTAGGDDTVSGDAGDDTIATGAGDDTITFTGNGDGIDSVTGGAGVDTILPLANSTVIGLRAISTVENIDATGFSGVSILGSTLNDVLNFTNVTLTNIVKIQGGGGNDSITGSAAADVIVGEGGTDTLNGGLNNDTIDGGGNNDTMNGGNGNDTFRYLAGAFGADTITGFDANANGGQDLINLSATGTLGINAGNFAANVTIGNGGGGATLITIAGGGTIRLTGVAFNAVNPTVTIADFTFV